MRGAWLHLRGQTRRLRGSPGVLVALLAGGVFAAFYLYGIGYEDDTSPGGTAVMIAGAALAFGVYGRWFVAGRSNPGSGRTPDPFAAPIPTLPLSENQRNLADAALVLAAFLAGRAALSPLLLLEYVPSVFSLGLGYVGDTIAGVALLLPYLLAPRCLITRWDGLVWIAPIAAAQFAAMWSGHGATPAGVAALAVFPTLLSVTAGTRRGPATPQPFQLAVRIGAAGRTAGAGARQAGRSGTSNTTAGLVTHRAGSPTPDRQLRRDAVGGALQMIAGTGIPFLLAAAGFVLAIGLGLVDDGWVLLVPGATIVLLVLVANAPFGTSLNASTGAVPWAFLDGRYLRTWSTLPVHRTTVLRLAHAHVWVAGGAIWLAAAALALAIEQANVTSLSPRLFLAPMAVAIPCLCGFVTCGAAGATKRAVFALMLAFVALPVVALARAGWGDAALPIALAIALAGYLPSLPLLRADAAPT